MYNDVFMMNHVKSNTLHFIANHAKQQINHFPEFIYHDPINILNYVRIGALSVFRQSNRVEMRYYFVYRLFFVYLSNKIKFINVHDPVNFLLMI